jgi:chromosome segregation ATPase
LTRALLDKQAEQFIEQIAIEIRIQTALYLRVQAFKKEISEFLTKLEANSERVYQKERAALIDELNKIEQNNLIRIAEEFKTLDTTRLSKEKINDLMKQVDSQLLEYKAAIKQYQATIERLDVVIEKYNTVVSNRINIHIEDINQIVSQIPQDHPALSENKQRIDQMSNQLRDKTISLSDYRNKVVDILRPLVKDTPHLVNRLNATDSDIKNTIGIEQKADELTAKRDAVFHKLVETQEKEAQLKEAKSALLSQLVKLDEPQANAPKADSSSLIASMLAKAEANSTDKPEEEFNTDKLAENVLNMLDDDNPEDDDLLASILGDLDEAEKSIDSEPPLKSYEEAKEDRVYNADEMQEPAPAYEEAQGDENINRPRM